GISGFFLPRSTLTETGSPFFEPNGLPGEAKVLVTEIFPSSAQGKVTHLRKGEGANGGEPRIVTGHRLTKNQRSQEVNTCDKRKTTSQIRQQNKSFGYLATSAQEPDRILVTEMMQRQRTKRNVICFNRVPFENVGFAIGNLRIIGAQCSGD